MTEKFYTREDLMTENFSSLWIEMERKEEKNILVCGYHGEWTRNNDTTILIIKVQLLLKRHE